MTKQRIRLALFAVLGCAGPIWGDPLPDPTGQVVLTVTGDIAVTNTPGAAEFDLAMLQAIGRQSFTTSTIWTDGEHEYTGTPLGAILDRLDVGDGELRAVALNDYTAMIPVADVTGAAPLLSWQVDGEYMSVRNRGPIWIVYPYDTHVRYRTDLVYSRSVWQLYRLEVNREAAD